MPISKQGSCKACGINFTYTARDSSTVRVTCSRACAAKVGSTAAAKTRVAATSTCVVCEAPFKSGEKRGNKTTCSRACTLTLQKPNRNGPMTKVKPCTVCGRFFAGPGKVCGQECKEVADAARLERARQQRRDNRTDRRMRERHDYYGRGKVIDKNITAKKLAELHDYTCQLCWKTVEPHKGKGHQPRGWSVGHIQPISQGGDTAHYNLWTECHECNTIKGDNTIEPYAFRGLSKAQKHAYMITHFDLFKD